MRKPLTEKQIEKLRHSMAKSQKRMNERSQNITCTNNPELKSQVENFVQMIASKYNFSGHYDVYTLYTTTNIGEEGTYALIHSDHEISNDSYSKECEKTILKEANTLQRELMKTSIALDYFFIMPYVTIKDEAQSCYLSKVRVTRRKNRDSRL